MKKMINTTSFAFTSAYVDSETGFPLSSEIENGTYLIKLTVNGDIVTTLMIVDNARTSHSGNFTNPDTDANENLMYEGKHVYPYFGQFPEGTKLEAIKLF